MGAALFFLIPAGALLTLAGFVTDNFNFWGWIN